jgi:hypothetical protein
MGQSLDIGKAQPADDNLSVLTFLVSCDQFQCFLLDSCSVHLLTQFHVLIPTLKSLESKDPRRKRRGF